MHHEYPPQSDLERPLLRLIVKRGGTIYFSRDGDLIERELADQFGLSKEAREYSLERVRSKGHRCWRVHIQFVRQKLEEKGEIDNNVHDRWKVMSAGYSRLGMQAPATAT